MDWFGQNLKFMSLGAGFFQQIGRVGLAREQKNLASWQHLANADRGLNAVHVRHDYVADDQIRLGFTCAVHGGSSRIDRRGVKSVLIENNRQSIGDYALV